VNTDKLHGDREAVVGMMGLNAASKLNERWGGLKWVAILVVILLLLLGAWKLKTSFDGWKGENCDGGESFAQCVVSNSTDTVAGALTGTLTALGSGWRRFAKSTGKGIFGFFAKARHNRKVVSWIW